MNTPAAPTAPAAVRFKSVWPKLNKQERIGSYLEQLQMREFNVCDTEVEETICLTCDEWDEFRHNMLNDRAWLSGKGGCPERGVRSVLLVVRPGETPADSVAIYVDPQGYEYARYVGFHLGEGNLVTNPPNLPTLAEAMATTLNGVSFKDRVLAESTAETQHWLDNREPQND